MHTRYWPVVAVAVLAAAGLAACGGGSKPNGVASLGGSPGPGAATTTTLPHGNPTHLVDEWASCMRTHGTPNLADPTIDGNGTIHITLPAQANSGSGGGAPNIGANAKVGLTGGGPCGAYLSAASKALGGPGAGQKPDPAKVLAFSQCMRAHGIADFPDPSGHGLSIHVSPGSDLNPRNPTFQAASKTCAAKTGVPGFGAGPQKGGIEVSSGGGPGLGPSGGPKSGSASIGIGG